MKKICTFYIKSEMCESSENQCLVISIIHYIQLLLNLFALLTMIIANKQCDSIHQI